MTPTTRTVTLALSFAGLLVLPLENADAMGRSGAPSTPPPGCCRMTQSEQAKLQAQLDALRQEMAALKAQIAANASK